MSTRGKTFDSIEEMLDDIMENASWWVRRVPWPVRRPIAWAKKAWRKRHPETVQVPGYLFAGDDLLMDCFILVVRFHLDRRRDGGDDAEDWFARCETALSFAQYYTEHRYSWGDDARSESKLNIAWDHVWSFVGREGQRLWD